MVTASKSPRQEIRLVLLSTVYAVIKLCKLVEKTLYNKAFNEAISNEERRIVCFCRISKYITYDRRIAPIQVRRIRFFGNYI